MNSLIGDNNSLNGYYIEELEKNGNAYKAGIRPTDIVVNIDNCNVYKVDDLLSILEEKKNGDVLDCTVISGGKTKKVKITIYN